jgi:hypothetical protein
VRADGIFGWGEEFAGERFVDDGDGARDGGVCVGERATLDDCVTECLEELRSDAGPTGGGIFARAGLGFSFDANFVRPHPTTQGRLENRADFFHAG